jgi:hypothetical protein
VKTWRETWRDTCQHDSCGDGHGAVIDVGESDDGLGAVTRTSDGQGDVEHEEVLARDSAREERCTLEEFSQ